MASTPEGKVKTAIKKYLKSLPNTWFYMPVQNGMGVIGIPDIIACIDGKFLAIETKAPGKEKTVTANQQMQIDGILAANGHALVTSSVEHLVLYLKLLKVVK